MAQSALILFKEILEGDATPPVQDRLRLLPLSTEIMPAISALYFESYEPGLSCATLDAAEIETKDTFAGGYGKLIAPATIGAFLDEQLVGCIMTVERGSWAQAPDCPFIIELFVDRGLRRRGIAQILIQSAVAQLAKAGYQFVALRVEVNNPGASELYRRMGFSSAH